MGNRAVIAFKDAAGKADADVVYVHWNGGWASIKAFCRAAHEISTQEGKERADIHDVFRAAQLLLDGSAYLEKWRDADCDNWDNGVYVIDYIAQGNDPRLCVVGRQFLPQDYQEEYDDKKTEQIFGAIMNSYRQRLAEESAAEDGNSAPCHQA